MAGTFNNGDSGSTVRTELNNRAAEINANTAKVSYPSADSIKLAGIEANATADQTDAEIATAYGNEVAQVSAGEITAGTEPGLRTYSPADVKAFVDAHAGGGGDLSQTDIDTLAELNAILTDANLIDTNDSRLSDARTPTSHTHTLSEVTDSGTAAALNVAASGDAASGEVVKGDDTRLTDDRTPASHSHTASEITDFDTEVSNNSSVSANTSKLSGIESGATADLTQTAAVYVSSAGSDSNDGQTQHKPKLTIGSAITVASALKTAGADAVSVVVVDGETYTEATLSLPEGVNLIAHGATLVGQLTIGPGCVVCLHKHFTEGGTGKAAVVHTSTASSSFYNVGLLDTRGTSGADSGNSGIVSQGTKSLNVHVGKIISGESARGLSCPAGGAGYITGHVGGIILAGDNGDGVYNDVGIVSCTIDSIVKESGSSTRAIYNNSFTCVVCQWINADVAYVNESGKDLRIFGALILGTRTGTPSMVIDKTNFDAKLDSSTVSAFGLTLVDDADAGTARTTLGLGSAATKGVTGSDSNAVTGTAGTSGNLLSWNADGDAVDSGVAASDVKTTRTGVYRELYIPAGSITPLASSTAEAGTEDGTSLSFDYFAFDGIANESLVFDFGMPATWNLGSVKAKFVYVPSSGCSSGDVVTMELAAVAVGDGDSWDASLGTGQHVDDTVLAGVDASNHTTQATAAITPGGTPAQGDLVTFKVTRLATDAADTMPEDLKLRGIWIQYAESATEPSTW